MKKGAFKKILFFLSLSVFLTACSFNQKEHKTETVIENTGEVIEEAVGRQEEEKEDVSQGSEIQVALFYYTYEDYFITGIRNEIDRIFEVSGVSYYDYDAANNQETQLSQIDTAIGRGARVLVVNQVIAGNEKIATEIVEKAKAADCYLIFFNRPVEKEENEGMVLGLYEKCAFVGTNPSEAGHMQGKMIGTYVLDHYETIDKNKDGIIQYALFKGQEDNVEATYRTKYSVEAADAILIQEGKPALEYFDSTNTDKYQVDPEGTWSENWAKQMMQENIRNYGQEGKKEIELIISNNDGMAKGAIEALNELGYNLGETEESTIPVFGVDAIKSAKELIEEGKMIGTIKQDKDGMVNAMIHLVGNGLNHKSLLEGTEEFVVSPNCKNKIFIPYAEYRIE